MDVLSLFDGISDNQLALKQAGIKYDKYFASEVNEYAIQVAQLNFPDTIQLGGVQGVQYEDGALFHHQNEDPLKNGGSYFTDIDLLIGRLSFREFGFTGQQLNFEDPYSKLFFDFVRLLRETEPKYFLFENIDMKREYLSIISRYLGVFPININSKLVNEQCRNRWCWTNIRTKKVGPLNELQVDIPQSKDSNLTAHILSFLPDKYKMV